MDAIDILSTLLGRKGQAPGQSRSGGSSTGSAQRSPAQAQRQRPMTVEDAAKSLEDLLGVADSRQSSPSQTPSQTPSPSADPPRASLPQRAPVPQSMNEHAKVLIRAMIAAAKSDGRITEDEQRSILNQCGQVGEAELSFLRAEFARPLDVKEVAWSIPLGLEEQAYEISLMAIELDEQSEAEYLGDLAHGLRLQPSRCNEIHRKHGAPEIFR
jgi:uncharacterized membrane protein YebE (DUF533 family)